MSQANLETAHHALQGLKTQPAALQKFHEALGSLSAATGLPYDDPTFTYVANTLINQRLISDNAGIARRAGTTTHNGFYIQSAITAAT
jgi:hypothetical protein